MKFLSKEHFHFMCEEKERLIRTKEALSEQLQKYFLECIDLRRENKNLEKALFFKKKKWW